MNEDMKKDMKKFNLFSLLLICLLTFTFYSTTNAQQEAMPDNQPKRKNKRFSTRPNLYHELELTPEQRQQIKRVHQNRKPLMNEAQRRVSEAMRNLDRAVYADSIKEGEIAERLKDLQAAQSEVANLRAYTELEVRKILTPEQLVKFRELRRRFNEKRENHENRRKSTTDHSDSNAPDGDFNKPHRKNTND
jgi:Spy/CpxP family protein refolding chaperone